MLEQQHGAIWPHDARHLLKTSDRICNRAEHAGRNCGVERVVVEREVADVGYLEIHVAVQSQALDASPSPLEHPRGYIDTHQRDPVGIEIDVATSTDADLEHPALGTGEQAAAPSSHTPENIHRQVVEVVYGSSPVVSTSRRHLLEVVGTLGILEWSFSVGLRRFHCDLRWMQLTPYPLGVQARSSGAAIHCYYDMSYQMATVFGAGNREEMERADDDHRSCSNRGRGR